MNDHSPVPTWHGYEIWQWIGLGVAAVFVVAIIAIISHRGVRRSLGRSVSAVIAIARVTAAETLRKKVLYAILVFAVGCLLAINFFTYLEPSEQDTMVKDLGLALITMFAGLIVIVTAMSLIPEEVERRTIYPILAKPVRRAEFVIGKFLGAVAPVAISMAVMLIVLMAMLAIKFHQWAWQIALAVVLMFFAMTVLAGVVILVSTRVSTILAALVGVVTFALGVNMESLYNLARPEHVSGNLFNAAVLSVLAATLPNLSMFDLRVQVASQVASPWNLLWLVFGNGVLYAIGYVAVLLIAASLLFNEREV